MNDNEKNKNTLIDLDAESGEHDVVPLILPDDFDTPRDLDERIIREMERLSKELDEKNKQNEKIRKHAGRFILRVAATAAVLALIVMVTPLRNYAVSASDDIKSWIKDISTENNSKIRDALSHENNDSSFENYYIVYDQDFKGGIAHGDTLCIIPNNGEKDSARITDKIAFVTNTWGDPGRDYFQAYVTDSNRIILSATNRIQKHAHLTVIITYEDGSIYNKEWDLVTSRPTVRFNPHYIKCCTGESFVPKYYVVVLDEKNRVSTANYLKGTDRIKWYTTDETIAKVDKKGNVTGLSAGFTTVCADTGFGNVASLSLKVIDQN